MTSPESLQQGFSLHVENVGGIDETTVDVAPGVTVLEGRNATNRTSFLQAVMAAMGSDQFTLKGDAEEGGVTLEMGDTVVERRFERRNGTVVSEGDGYLDDPETAELFAFLIEENDSRRAVARGDDLREILTRPIDTDEIEAEIERLQSTKRSVDEYLSRIEDRERDLVDLERREGTLESEIEERRERLDDLEAEIADTDLEAEREVQEDVEEQLDALKERRARLDDIRFEIETLEETIETLEQERADKRAEREDLVTDPDVDVDSLRDELESLRDRKRRINAQINELQSVVRFNEEMLEGTDSEIASLLGGDAHAQDDPTDRLLDGEESIVCWTCGSEVAKEDVEETLDDLQSARQEKLRERKRVQSECDEIQETVSELERSERELDALNERLAEIDADVERKRDRIEELESDREALHEEVEDLEAAVEAERSSNYEAVVDLHKRANRVEMELERKEDDLASVREEIDEIESLVDERAEYEQRREQITEQLEELRTRIDHLEEQAVEAFNESMMEVLDILDYKNLERIWIERRERETRRGRRNVTETHFDLHVVREAESGETYEGTIDTLSESELEVVGLVFALAGYLVHDLHETVPIMLLDSLEAIDADRIGRLVDYFADYPTYLVAALLPEDANAVDADHRITDI